MMRTGPSVPGCPVFRYFDTSVPAAAAGLRRGRHPSATRGTRNRSRVRVAPRALSEMHGLRRTRRSRDGPRRAATPCAARRIRSCRGRMTAASSRRSLLGDTEYDRRPRGPTCNSTRSQSRPIPVDGATMAQMPDSARGFEAIKLVSDWAKWLVTIETALITIVGAFFATDQLVQLSAKVVGTSRSAASRFRSLQPQLSC